MSLVFPRYIVGNSYRCARIFVPMRVIVGEVGGNAKLGCVQFAERFRERNRTSEGGDENGIIVRRQ